MKKLIYLFLFIFIFISSAHVYAQSIDINLIEYNADSGRSMIAISNIGDEDLHDIKISIDSSREIPVVQLLNPGNSAYYILGVDSGEHEVTVNSNEDSISKTLLFSQSKENLKEEKEQEKKAKEEALRIESELKKISEQNRMQTELELEQEMEKAIAFGFVEERKYDKELFVWIGAGILIIIAIVLWLMSRRK
ncbi:hypothetical protein HYT56_04545 [Candidatus Woesearchaeota archaeon]|nr:hypothetical protein [Candidatus Woesearchaeota archaeon]